MNNSRKRSISYGRYNTHIFFFRFLLFFSSPVQIKLSKTHIYFPSLSTYAIIVPFLSTIYPSIHRSNDTKRLDVGVGMHYTITDPTIASKYTHTYIYKYIEWNYVRNLSILLDETSSLLSLYMKQNTVLKEKEKERDRTPISHSIMKRKKKKKDRHTYWRCSSVNYKYEYGQYIHSLFVFMSDEWQRVTDNKG